MDDALASLKKWVRQWNGRSGHAGASVRVLGLGKRALDMVPFPRRQARAEAKNDKWVE